MRQADLGLNVTTKRTRKREFLAEMERVVPWAALVALITPYAPGRQPRSPALRRGDDVAHPRTAGNVNDVVEANTLPHGEETEAWGDAGNQGAGKRHDANVGVRWNIAMRRGKRKPDERAEPADYFSPDYVQGHMAPAGDMPTPNAMRQSFTLFNAVPQNPSSKSGSWLKIEKDTGVYVMRAAGDVSVITGPVFEPSTKTIGPNQVRGLAQLFKLVYDPHTQKAWAHWQQNAEGTRAGQPISYGDSEARPGREWLPGVALH